MPAETNADIVRLRGCLENRQYRNQYREYLTYPGDLALYTRHYTDLKKLEGRYPMPELLTLQQLDKFLKFLAQAGVSEASAECCRYPVQWIDQYCQVN